MELIVITMRESKFDNVRTAQSLSKVEIAGASGQFYRYVLLGEGVTPPSQAANLVIAEFRRGDWRVLHVGHTDYLPRRDWRPILDRIREQQHPRAQLLYRLNVSHGVREGEADDIGRRHLLAPARAA